MPRDKIPVGRTLICNPSYLRRIDPIWVHGPVPPRFWEDPAKRRDYLLWLGCKRKFRYMEDWYRLSFHRISRHHPSGPVQYWRGSPTVA